MDYKVLKEKFFSGTTTREEEDALRRYLKGDNLPQEAAEDKEMLLAMLQPVEYDCREAMDGISAMIDALSAQESVDVREKSAPRRVVLRYLYTAVAVAAAVLLVFMLSPYSTSEVQQPGDTLLTDAGRDNVVTVVVGEQPQGADTRYVGENVQRSGNADFLEQNGRYRNDTFSNPEDVADHVEVLLAIFSDAAVHGIKEQEEHLSQLIVLNNAN